MTTPYQALTHLLHLAQREPVPEDDIVLTGEAPVLPTNFLLGTAGAAVIAAGGVAAADLWYLRTGRHQRVAVDLRRAAATNGWLIPTAGRGRPAPV